MQAEILASQSSDWQTVIETELGNNGGNKEVIQYQKHMTHHMVAEVDQGWFATLRHAFLVRHPAEVVASYVQKREHVDADDVGFRRQRELFEMVADVTGAPAVVIDSKAVLSNPEAELTKLCQSLDVPFDSNMLAWPAGKRETDGAWAPHWYQNVERSTGFSRYQERPINLTSSQQRVVDECLPDYEHMMSFA